MKKAISSRHKNGIARRWLNASYYMKEIGFYMFQLFDYSMKYNIMIYNFIIIIEINKVNIINKVDQRVTKIFL